MSATYSCVLPTMMKNMGCATLDQLCENSRKPPTDLDTDMTFDCLPKDL